HRIRAELSTGIRGYPQKSAVYPHPEQSMEGGRGHIWVKKTIGMPEIGVVDRPEELWLPAGQNW
ncbi:MAG: hypothetical protein N2556_05100, partial [Anaerolineae bacterium]|nr:hypothetical protein [Anaerolineae bacterium]